MPGKEFGLLMRCPKCGYPNQEGAVACEHCGARLGLPCPRCGFGLDEDASACPRCGQAVVAGRAARSPLERELFVLGGRYQVLQQVSRTRISAVYRALDDQSGEVVAVKRLDLVALVTPDEKRRALADFEREVTALETLRHPGVVPILSHFRGKDSVGVVMPWVEGPTLQDIYHRGPLPESQVRALGAQLADAIAFLHSQSPPVVLRDLKPSHVIVDQRGNAILLDLGLSRHFRPGQSRGAANRGTPPFEAPEQVDNAYAGPESDIYALGTLLLLMARGPKSDRSTRMLSPTLRKTLARARRRDPENRYSSMSRFRQALELDSEPTAPIAAQPTAPLSGSSQSRSASTAADAVGPPMTAPHPPVIPDITVLTKRLRVVRDPNRHRVGYRLRLHNNLQQPVVVRVQSAVPWLTPASETVELAPGADSAVLIRAELDQIPPHTQRLARAIQVNSATRHWVRAEVVEPPPVLELDRQVLDFGQVGPEGAATTLTVRNAGGGQLSAHLSTAVPWLHVTSPEIELDAGQSAAVEIRLSPEAPPAGGAFPRALLVDSDVGQAYCDVSFSRGRAELYVEPESLDFGRVRYPQTALAELVLSNPGSAPVTARVRSSHEALHIGATEVSIPPRHRTRLTVRLETASLAPGMLRLPAGIRVSSSVAGYQIPVQTEVARPLLAVSETHLDFGALEPEQIPSARASLVVSNRGSEPLTFEFVPQVPWLAAWPAEGTLTPSSSTVLAVSLRGQAAEVPGDHEGSPAAIIRSETESIAITACYRLIKPILEVEPTFLDFGVMPEQGVSERHLVVKNAGTGELHWRASTDAPWIELSPASGSVPEGGSASVVVRAYGLALPAGTRQARAELTFSGPRNRRSISAGLALSQPILAVEPALDLPDSLDFAPVEGRLILFNRGVGDLRATVHPNATWISVPEPDVIIPSGRSGSVLVRAQPPVELGPGQVSQPAALLVSANGGDAEVEVRLQIVARPQLELSPDRLVLKPGTEGTIIVRNLGLATAKGTVEASAEWLSVSPKQLTIRPGHRARLRAVACARPPGEEERTTVIVKVGERTEEVEVVIAE